MYVIYDCQSSTDAWKAKTLKELKSFAENWLQLETDWLNFRKGDCVLSPCLRYEANKVDGRTITDIDWAL